MVRAHLAVLLIGMGANQAIASDDDDRDRHWAEGVYFPPVIAPTINTNHSLSLDSLPAKQIRRYSRSTEDYYNSLNALPTPQSLGYPVDGYDPYRTSERGVNDSFPRNAVEYVPKNYSPSAPNKYNENRNGYRVNGFGSREDYHRDKYTGYYGQADRRYRDTQQGGFYQRDYDSPDLNFDGRGYRHPYGLKEYTKAMSLNNSRSYGNPNYGSISGDIPYYLALNPSQMMGESRRIMQSPWELMWPLSNSGLLYYPLW